jgi:hypothetical protein
MKKLLVNLTLFALLISAMVTNAQFPQFTRIDTGAIAASMHAHLSAGTFDVDNDGDLDVIVANFGVYSENPPLSLFINERNNYFRDRDALIDPSSAFILWGPSPFCDIDNDGDLDLVGIKSTAQEGVFLNNGYGYYTLDTLVANNGNIPDYTALIDMNSDGYLDIVHVLGDVFVLYNNGEGDFLECDTIPIDMEERSGWWHSTSWSDADEDGDMDVFVGFTDLNLASWGPGNVLLQNNGDSFESLDNSHINTNDSSATDCVNWADYDNDGDMDLYVLNMTVKPDGPPSKLYKNLGNMEFEEYVFEDEMYRNSFTNSSNWGDLDNDGDLDLYVSVENNPFPFGGQTSATPYNILFRNDGEGVFTNILEHSLAKESSHTANLFDQDNDGDLDVLLVRYSWSNKGRNNLFLNEGNENSWILINCVGTVSNRSAIGARVYAKAFINGNHTIQTREITPVNGHISFANLRVHFGLGDATTIDTLEIHWPSGHNDIYLGVEANRFYRAIEDSALELDLRATNYIEYRPEIEIPLMFVGDSITIDLADHFRFVTGDTVPEITGDTLQFMLIDEGDPDILIPSLEGTALTIKTGGTAGSSAPKIKVTTEGFTSRVDFINATVYDSVKQKVNTCSAEVSSYHDAETHYNYAIDGDMETRWGSDYSDNQWIKITLDTIHIVAKVVIYWEDASAKRYKILTSMKNISWDTVYSESSGDGETDIIVFKPRPVKYIQLNAIEGNTEWGFSIWEIEIYSTDMYNAECEPTNIVSEKIPDDIIHVYPNPSTDHVFIDFNQPMQGETFIEVLEYTGKPVLMDRIYGNNLSRYKMDVSKLKCGIYILRIINENKCVYKKIIKSL